MALNIFRHEFRIKFRSALGWSAAIAGLILVFSAMFSSVAGQIESLNAFLANYPKELLIAFGLNGVDLSTVLGFFSFVFLFIQICLAIQAANYGFSLVSMEEADRTADFLLTKPVKRTQIMTSKLLAAVASLTVTNGAVWASSFVFLNLFKGDHALDTSTLMLLLASIAIFQLFFLGVGLCVSLLVRRIRSVIPYSLALAFGMYVLSAFGSQLGTSVLEKITPFKHFEPAYVLAHKGYDPALVVVSVVVILISIIGGYYLYSRRDIPAVS
jgi:ABC-2 type transport system permease protein